ncbi:MAG TPA: aldehyde dehydrogenase [Solirubrobacteraceae bacterium]|nr:aldehyde dehydrogenase [Solirubrobacteraceae bacterium]
MLPREFPNLYIDGRWQEPDSKERFDVVSPATGEQIGYVPAANSTDIDRAVEAARKAFYETDWPTRPVEERAELMERLAALIAEHQPEFRDLIVDELGHTKLTAEVYHSVAPTLHWNYYAKVGREHTFAEVREADLSPMAGNAGGLIMKYESKSLLVREPVGVVAAMTAFNFPLSGIAQKTAPALVAGCTVVIKSPDPDPLSTFAMADLVTEAGFPPGVINIVAATREASEHLVTHPDVDMVSFTGSVEVGKQIGKMCGELIRPCVLELGGKSAAIVLEDADVDAVLPILVGSSAGTSQGESCVCMSRILVPKSQYDEIATKLTEAFKGLKVGDPHADDTVIGPLITEAHQRRVLGYIKKAVDEGATVATGGGVPEGVDRGWYVEPTLLTNVTNDMTVAQEEIFGPVITLIPYEDEAEAVRIANDSRFGLSGSVFTGNPQRGFEIARQIRAGTFSVNTMAADFNSSFGGYKESGIGREHGPYAIDEYLLSKTISIDPSEEFPEDVVRSAQPAPAHA